MMNIYSRVSAGVWWFLLWLPASACQAQVLQPTAAVQSLTPKLPAFVYINGAKYRLLQRHPNYWLLVDPRNAQPLHLTNQLVVSGVRSVDDLRKRVLIKPAFEVKQLADEILLISGSIAQLMALEQQLKQLGNVQTEWQLFYLPIKSQPDR